MSDDLFDALAAVDRVGDDRAFGRLCEENAQWIADNWDHWSRVPPELRERLSTDRVASEQRAMLVFRIARELDFIGYRGPMDRLRGSDGQSPLTRFVDNVRKAQLLAEYGDHEACRALLLQTVEQLTGRLAGPAGAEPLYVRGHVQLALCCARLGDLRAAVEHIRRARDFELKAGRVYLPESGALLDTLTVALEGGAEVMAVRGTIVHAQMLSDIGEFAASNAELQRLTDSGAYVGKVYGLIGLNHFRLGDRAAAREWTIRAVAKCERAGDRAGVMIYRTNLRAIDRAD